MSAIATLRRLRHGPLKFMGPLWVRLGELYRSACRAGWFGAVPQHIGPYGPFKLRPEFAFSNFEHWGDAHNGGFSACIEACRGAHCVLDIGGHIGLVALPMSTVLAPGGQVHCFEPSSANLQYLRAHVAANQANNVVIVDALIGKDEQEAVPFFEQAWVSGRNGLAIKRDHDQFVETTRRQVSLDQYCSRLGLAPDVIKIDVEGAEYGVLSGAAETLRRHHPTIFLSIHPTELKLLGSSVDALTALIADFGYRCFEIDGTPVKQFRLREYLLLPQDKDISCSPMRS